MKTCDDDRVCLVEEHSLYIDGMSMPLRRFARGRRGGRPVLLLHGGNTSSELFHWPRGGLARYLSDRGCDVWTLDWRASAELLVPLMRKPPLFEDVVKERDVLTLDRVAQEELPAALRTMRARGATEPLAILGFCLAGNAVAKAVARGYLEGLNVGNVVLATMGLFFEVPWSGWVKAEDFVIERVLATDPQCRSIDPFQSPERWPAPMRQAYEAWPKAWLGASGEEPIDTLFRHLSFCYGQPYARARLDPAFERGLDQKFFGPIHLGLFLHAGQMVRRGYSARFGALDVVDRSRIRRGSGQVEGSDLIPSHFQNKRVTLITGADDQLWHRDSVDIMFEWLRNEGTQREGPPQTERLRHRKHVVPRYGHLDIFWGRDAARDIYYLFERALTQPPS